MKKNLLLIFAVLFCMASQALAQQRLSEWVASLGEEESTPSETQPSLSHKRVAYIFSQTHRFDSAKSDFVLDDNYAFRLGNYLQVKSALMQYGQFDAIGSLAGPELRKENVKKVFQLLKEVTQPGDEIFIYWESHGDTDKDGKIFGTSSEESDSCHEFLFLGIPAREELITDDEFAQMLLTLKERRVMILMEACHSGGLLSSEAQSRNMRSLRRINTDDSEPYAEIMDEKCGNFDYSSIEPLLNGIFTQSGSSSSNRSTLLNFVGRNKGKKSRFFQKAFKKFQVKDINSDHPNISVIFSAGESENSYCALVNTRMEIVVYNRDENRWHAKKGSINKNEHPVGAPVFSLVLALSDTSGKYSSGNHTDFADVWKIVKYLVPLNNDRIDSSLEASDRNGSQTPQYLNNTGPIDIRPKR